MEGKNSYPKLRPVDIFPAEVSNQKVICLRDPLKLSEETLFYSYGAFFIISLLDGQHSILDIQAEYMRQFGEILYQEKILKLIEQLEAHYLLENERSRQLERKIIEDFKNASTRPMALAGEGYEEDPQKLQARIEGYFAPPAGPGRPLSAEYFPGNLTGVIAPHIDYRRGGRCYAWAHQVIRQSPPPDLFIILGTAHSAAKNPFILTQKDFLTPWGPVPTDRSFLDEIISRCSADYYEEEFAHKSEHSIELQLIFLRAHWGEKPPFQIIPVLCGSFHEAVRLGKSPMELPEIRVFVEALRTAIAGSKKRICLLASADLAHVGLRFGDAEAPNRFSLQSLAEKDQRMLGHVTRIDAEAFYDFILREKDRRRICGLSSIYTLLKVVDARTGKILKYEQSPDPVTGSAVTLASLAFFS